MSTVLHFHGQTMTRDEFKRRVAANNKEYQVQDNTTMMPCKFYGWDYEPDKENYQNSFNLCNDKHYDILGAVITGTLPLIRQRQGGDAIRWNDNDIAPVVIELKICDRPINRDNLILGSRGGMYVISPTVKKSGIYGKSNLSSISTIFCAKFSGKDSPETLKTKKTRYLPHYR